MSSKANKANHAPASAQDSWSRVRLGDICEIVRGVTYKKDQAGEQPAKGMLPILRATNIQDNALVLASDLVYVPTDVVSEEQMLRAGDIVVATSSGSKHLVGKTAQVKESWAGSFGAFCAVLRPKADIDHRYLGYFFGSREYKDYISAKALGVNINNLRRGDLEEISVPVAPLDQQKRIVAEIEKQFSRLDEAVANLKRVKANLKRYKAAVLKAAVEGRLVETEAELARKKTPSPLVGEGGGEGASYETGTQLLQRILETRRSQWKGKGKYKEPAAPDTTDLPELPEGWVWASADQLMALITDGEHITPQRSDSGVLLLSARNVLNGRLDLTQVDYIPEEEHQRICKRLTITEGDVLLSCSGSVGRSCVVPHGVKFSLVRSVAVLRPAGISSEFVCYQIQSPLLQSQIKSRQTQTAQANIFQGKIRQLVFALPPEAEQHRIVAEIDRRLSLVRETEAQVNADLLRAERLRQSILSGAFAGGFRDARNNTLKAAQGQR